MGAEPGLPGVAPIVTGGSCSASAGSGAESVMTIASAMGFRIRALYQTRGRLPGQSLMPDSFRKARSTAA